MTDYEEYNFVLNMLIDLKTNYKEHNSKALTQLIEVVSYRIKCIEK